MSRKGTRARSASPPLVVGDLDGTLLRTGPPSRVYFSYLGANPLWIFPLPSHLARGNAPLKAEIASLTHTNAANLPYNNRTLVLIHDARARGKATYLASARSFDHQI